MGKPMMMLALQMSFPAIDNAYEANKNQLRQLLDISLNVKILTIFLEVETSSKRK